MTVPVVSTGVDLTCSLMPSGAVFCSGRNDAGQLGQGNGAAFSIAVPAKVHNLPAAVAVSVGQFLACAIDQSAVLWCWGANSFGQLGDGTKVNRSLPVKVSGGLKWAAVAAGGTFTCGITVAGAVYCWGENDFGQLGNGTTTNSKVPVLVSTLRLAVAIAAGPDRHACVLVSGGGVECWGANNHGEVGDGSTTNRRNPVQVLGLTSGVTAITAGGGQTCALRPGGAAVCWGSNRYGEIGDGTTTDRSAPTAVAGLSGGVQQISAGADHTCALVATSAIVVDCWGDGRNGDLGNGIENAHVVTTPATVFGLMGAAAGGVGGPVQVAAGGGHTCAVIGNGEVECWGGNTYGQVGDGTRINRPSPTLVIGLTAGPQQISEAGIGGCAVTQSLGAACWGSAAGNDLSAHATAIPVSALPAGVASVSAGFEASCAISTDGALQCWGTNSGAVGDGTTAPQPIPKPVTSPPSLVGAVSTGMDDVCALSPQGGAYCWGSNHNGELGDGSTNDSFIPVSVENVGHVSQIAQSGDGSACAVASTGKAYCWGSNTFGELGNGKTKDSILPVVVKGLPSNPVVIGTGGGFINSDLGNFACAVVVTGDVWCWGYDGDGELGDGSTPDASPHTTPVKVLLPGPARDVVGGAVNACALLDDGSVWCWGGNNSGELGSGGSPVQSSTPVEVAGLTSGVLEISADDSLTTCALLSSPAQVQCWGDSFYDELGDGANGGIATTPQPVVGL